MRKLYSFIIITILGHLGCADLLYEQKPPVNLWGESYSIETTFILILNDKELSGPIPSEIGNLTNLTTLDLHGNQLTGEIPPEIGNLTNLTILDLRDNQFSGTITEEICNQENLYLELANNQFCPPYPVCAIDKIGEQNPNECFIELWGESFSIENTTTLSLNNSGISGSIPFEIGELVNLTTLDLGTNQLTGEIPAEIGNLINLSYLNLSNNQLSGELPVQINNLINLTTLNIQNNQLTGIIPEEICNQGDVNPKLANNQFCPPYPACTIDQIGEQNPNECFIELWGESYSTKNTYTLILNDSELSGPIPPEIGELINLTTLDLGDNQLMGEIPAEIGNLINLSYLDLSNNQFTGIIPNEICNQGDVNPELANNQFCPPYPVCMEDYVEEQDLTNCEVPEGYVEIFGQFFSIEQTTELNLFQSGLTGSIPYEIFELINLTYLNLSFNELTGSIPSEVGNLVNLISLSIYNNQLTGEIPPTIGNLANLERLYLQYNQLEGGITFIDNLISLKYLNIFNNQLTGEIPAGIGDLTNLTFLKLYSNQLTGEIPMSICDLDINWSSTNYFNINQNQFCPPYPSCIIEYIGDQDITNCE